MLDKIIFQRKHPERIKRMIKNVVQKLNYHVIAFPVQEKDFNQIEVKNNIYINVLGYEDGLVFPTYLSD